MFSEIHIGILPVIDQQSALSDQRSAKPFTAKDAKEIGASGDRGIGSSEALPQYSLYVMPGFMSPRRDYIFRWPDLPILCILRIFCGEKV
jgi:hypothetical protein